MSEAHQNQQTRNQKLTAFSLQASPAPPLDSRAGSEAYPKLFSALLLHMKITPHTEGRCHYESCLLGDRTLHSVWLWHAQQHQIQAQEMRAGNPELDKGSKGTSAIPWIGMFQYFWTHKNSNTGEISSTSQLWSLKKQAPGPCSPAPA